MRREQVQKVACNHNLTSDMKLQPLTSSDTSWCWFANDFAEEEGKIENFAVKFKVHASAYIHLLKGHIFEI